MDETGPAPTPDAVPEAAQVLRGRHVLLVAAEGFDRLVAAELLEEGAGAVVLVAPDGERAVEVLRSQRVDAVLLDLDGADGGATVTARLRAHGLDGRVPIVAMAGPGDGAGLPGAPDGFAGHVARPLHPAALFATLARLLPAVDGPAGGASGARADAPVPVVFAIGLERCLGRRDLYERVAQRFLDQGAQSVQGIGDALAQGERKTALRLAHSLISTAGTLGAMTLSDGARVLYAALAEGRPGETVPLAALAAEADRVRAALRQHLQARGGAGAAEGGA